MTGEARLYVWRCSECGHASQDQTSHWSICSKPEKQRIEVIPADEAHRAPIGLYVCDHGCWDLAEDPPEKSIPCAFKGHSEMAFIPYDKLVAADEAQAEVAKTRAEIHRLTALAVRDEKQNARLTERVGELEGALGDIADYSMGEYDNCPDCGGPARARAALATQNQGEGDG